MQIARKIIGAFVAVFVAVPVLCGVIWAVGAAQGALSEGFISEVPKEVAREAPALVKELYEAAQVPGAVKDANAKMWLAVAAKQEISPPELLEKLGVYSWLANELSAAMKQVEDAARGRLNRSEVSLDLKPLKAALVSPDARKYLAGVLDQLPDCTPEDRADWSAAVIEKRELSQLRACNPGNTVTKTAVDLVLDRVLAIPDERKLMKGTDMPFRFDALATAGNLLYLLFLVPLGLVALAAGIGGTSPGGFRRWSGACLMAGAAIPLLATSLIKAGLLAAMHIDPAHWDMGKHSHFWTSETSTVLARHMTGITSMIMDRVFSPVWMMSAVILGVGVLLLVLSFVGRTRAQS